MIEICVWKNGVAYYSGFPWTMTCAVKSNWSSEANYVKWLELKTELSKLRSRDELIWVFNDERILGAHFRTSHYPLLLKMKYQG